MEEEATAENQKENGSLSALDDNVDRASEASEVFSEEVEPRLKYTRLVNDVQDILSKDTASCVAVHPKFLCMGTEWGRVHLLDLQGNSIKNKQLRHHSVCVSSISIDIAGEYIASCSHDGKVHVYGLYSTSNDMHMNLETLLSCVQIDPHFKKLAHHRRFVTGDNKLLLHEKSLLSRIRTTTLCDASMEGGVIHMAWSSHFIAWATNIGVRVYDISARTSLGLIKWKRNPSISPEQVKCSLVWASDERSLLVGWMSTICLCNVRKRSPTELPSRDLPEHIVEQVAFIQTDYIVCGLGPLSSDELVVLGYFPAGLESPERPQILVYQISTKTAISTDSLSLRGYERYAARDYQLVCLIEETRFTVVSPKDIVIASPYDADDRVEWLIDNNKFEEAMEAVIANEKQLVRNSLIDVGRKYLDHLLFLQEYELAGDICKKVLGVSKHLWEEEVYKFARVHELRKIARHLPQGDYKLDSHIYEMVLFEYLQVEPEGFLPLVKDWPPDLYKVTAIINAVLDYIRVRFDPAGSNDSILSRSLLEALAILYSHNRQYDKAFAMYLRFQHKGVFEMIRKHDLYNVIQDKVEQLMELDIDQCIQMLIERDKIDTKVVVAKLEHKPMFLYLYLDALERRETKGLACKDYHGILVRLYAEFSRDKLLPLLRRSDNYPIREALNICKTNNFVPEMVYLLGREGNTQEALKLIMEQLKDIEQATSFCQEHDDQELWMDLINYALDKPEHITYLLQRLGMFVDPRMLVQRIPDRLDIPGLKYSLVKMMRDYNLQVSVQEGCKKILVSDYFNLQERLVTLQTRGIVLNSSCVCGACHESLMSGHSVSSIITFNCKHSYHEQCLPTSNLDKCAICCTEDSRKPNNSSL